MVFRCLRKLDSECMEVGRSCPEKHAPSMYLTYTEKFIRQISSHAWGREVGLVLKQQRYAVAYFFWAHAGFCTQTLSSARNWHSLFCTGHLLNWEALFAVIFRGDLRPGHDPKRPLALWRRFESLDQLLTIIKHLKYSAVSQFQQFWCDFDTSHLWHLVTLFMGFPSRRLELGLPLLERLRAAQLPVACSRIA